MPSDLLKHLLLVPGDMLDVSVMKTWNGPLA